MVRVETGTGSDLYVTNTDTTSTGWYDTYYIVPDQEKIKKLLKKMISEMCKTDGFNKFLITKEQS